MVMVAAAASLLRTFCTVMRMIVRMPGAMDGVNVEAKAIGVMQGRPQIPQENQVDQKSLSYSPEIQHAVASGKRPLDAVYIRCTSWQPDSFA